MKKVISVMLLLGLTAVSQEVLAAGCARQSWCRTLVPFGFSCMEDCPAGTTKITPNQYLYKDDLANVGIDYVCDCVDRGRSGNDSLLIPKHKIKWPGPGSMSDYYRIYLPDNCKK